MTYGISATTLPIFLGGECVIEHIKTLRIKNRDIHIDARLNIGPVINNKNYIDNDFRHKGWVDISSKLLNLDGLFAFVGRQTFEYTPMLSTRKLIPLKLIKFRHSNGKTQARIAFAVGNPKSSGNQFHNLDNYIDIFIYQKLDNIEPNRGYGIHIYDQFGTLKYKDGLKLLNNIRKQPINFEAFSNNINIGNDKAILQTTHAIRTSCSNSFNQWVYSGAVFTSYLRSDGSVSFPSYEDFAVYGRRHTYPSYANGGAYTDNVISVDHIIYIDKPHS